MELSFFDVETYSTYFLVKFSTGETYEMYEGLPLDTIGLAQTLDRYTLVGFNSNSYDLPVVEYALTGASNAQLKAFSDQIILGDEKVWHRLHVDHIDMINVAPGGGSLKMYGSKLHTQKLQDLPYDPDMEIKWIHRIPLATYCGNDIKITEELYRRFPEQIALRRKMSEQYGVDLRSKSDAQIAETVMKKLLPFTVTKAKVQPGHSFKYRPPEWLEFVNLDVLDLIARSDFVIGPSGNVLMPDLLADAAISIGNCTYKMGLGGLHSQEEGVFYVADNETVIQDWDVASYYPSIILRTGIFPKQIGPIFNEIYRDWYESRLKAKAEGRKEDANTQKTLLNGSFGKLGSHYSIFYAPAELIQVTVTGQLALLMLIERMELSGIRVISANTDGIVLMFNLTLQWLVDSVIKWWEGVTEFNMERTDYAAIYSRDVNNYITIKPDGNVKLKGCFAPPEPGASGWPNPSGKVCVDAVIAYLKNGVPLEQTIYACADIRDFVYVRQVNGGAVYNPNPVIPKKTSRREMKRLLELYGFEDYEKLQEWAKAGTTYLGRVVRWFYAAGTPGHIEYKVSGNLVPRTIGCMPCMDLPDVLPANINYDWYIEEAKSLLNDVGVRL